MKCINYSSLLQFSLLLPNCEGSHSAFINSNTKIPICIHGRPTSPEHVRGGGVSLGGSLKHSRIEPRVTLPYIHNHACANAALLTYLLNGGNFYYYLYEPSQQKHAHGGRTHYSTAQRRPLVRTARLSPQHLSTAGVTFDCKISLGVQLTHGHPCTPKQVIWRPGGDSAAQRRRPGGGGDPAAATRRRRRRRRRRQPHCQRQLSLTVKISLRGFNSAMATHVCSNMLFGDDPTVRTP